MALVRILAVLLLRGCCPSVPRRLPPGLCGGKALFLPGTARLDISLLTDWKLALESCFLVRSPTVRCLSMGGHGWWFVYVSTFLNVVYIISWKYWITFLQNLSFLLK